MVKIYCRTYFTTELIIDLLKIKSSEDICSFFVKIVI